MKRLFALIFGLAFFAVLADNVAPAFHFGGRNFSSEEAARIAALPAPASLSKNATIRQKIEAQREIVGGIALFARDGIELSAGDAMLELGGELLLMPEPAKAALARELASRKITQEAFFLNESQTLQRQFAAAAHKWYHKKFSGVDTITDAQIRDWYFRHQDRFLVETLDAENCFMLPNREAVPGVLSMLSQGMSADDVRLRAHIAALPADALTWLKSDRTKREKLAPGYTLYSDETHVLLMPDGALKRSYRKLDKPLRDAIRNALYDALARARLDVALQAELKDAKFEFLD